MLRPIGQVLEGLGMQSFSLTIEGAEVLVHGRRSIKQQEAGSGSSLKALWRLLRGVDEKSAPERSSDVVELRYTPEDIARLDAEGQAKRGASGGVQDAHSLSQILRAAGSFVDQKNGRLLGIRKEDGSISLAYESDLNTKVSEQFAISELYDFWVKMYLKRSRRPEPKF
jgi:hypothetical protein